MSSSNEKKTDNKSKNEHGTNGFEALEEYIKTCKERNLIEDYKCKQNMNIQDYKVYTPFIIKFSPTDKFSPTEYWALFSTTSIRDRIKSNFWDSFLFKELYKENETSVIKKCYLVCPDSISTKKGEEQKLDSARKYIKKINTQGIKRFDTLDGIITLTELRKLIEQKKSEGMNPGAASNFQGKNFEDEIATILEAKANIDYWNGDDLATGNSYDIFEKILVKFGLNRHKHHIESIEAKTGKEIPKLPSGGTAKTDILVELTTCSDSPATEKRTYTISVKYHKGNWVTAHEYNAQSFIDTLHIKEESVKNALLHFQQKGGITYLNEEDKNAFKTDFQKYKKALCEWVIGGKNGDGDPKTQWANYVLTGNKNCQTGYDIEISTLDEYVNALIVLEQRKLEQGKKTKGQLNTPFQWTYPAKSKGSTIQLKMYVLTKEELSEAAEPEKQASKTPEGN